MNNNPKLILPMLVSVSDYHEFDDQISVINHLLFPFKNKEKPLDYIEIGCSDSSGQYWGIIYNKYDKSTKPYKNNQLNELMIYFDALNNLYKVDNNKKKYVLTKKDFLKFQENIFQYYLESSLGDINDYFNKWRAKKESEVITKKVNKQITNKNISKHKKPKI